MAYETASKGAAASKFKQMIRSQGGDERILDDPDLLPRTPSVAEFRSRSHGFVTRCDAKLLGLAANALGAGRTRVDDTVHPAVGLYLERKTGDQVKRNQVLCHIYWDDEKRLQSAMPLIEEAFDVQARPPKPRPLIHAVLEG